MNTDEIMIKMVEFITTSDLPMDFFYQSCSIDELKTIRNESLKLNDNETVTRMDKELLSRPEFSKEII